MQWDIFCRVIDNFGDVGVCWRLSAQLARRGERVRLWLDDPQALAWMAPGALQGDVPGIEVLHWTSPLPAGRLGDLPPADVWIEAFGCDPPAECVAQLADHVAAGAHAPVWINLEYLSAESYVERSHRLPSPVMSGPARGLGKWFFYPGFTERTGGLLREPDLLKRQAAFQPEVWLADLRMPVRNGSRRVSLFCYEPPALSNVLQQAGQAADASDWLVTPGRAWQLVQQAGPVGPGCRLHALPLLPQHDFDHLLWSADLNFVRGEDSLARALWAGKPFVWHIYPQHDDAHHAKLQAFLDWMQAPASLRDFHHAWNGTGAASADWPDAATLQDWEGCARAARERLLAQADLCSQLIRFVLEKR
ncbi:elongation factor P maturation arginine rhamnosyltransferase EarP [Hydrogenophaga sp.]|uniref:elongation factor P maturation arginine rhamnosyltransferase EarP n=1 Tax=Hydrogenophaga sp. TaxID=1904254 RepID=UPI0027239980|nr:elongation factor P maturation arginine rhamnosyltransferase EarP [Hydrogenophaga sp.]MDO9438491.1 elongation factor P maturation arginine rhamnosyltransferase EarP [Hydrogenophaga sp.]